MGGYGDLGTLELSSSELEPGGHGLVTLITYRLPAGGDVGHTERPRWAQWISIRNGVSSGGPPPVYPEAPAMSTPAGLPPQNRVKP